VCSSDLQLLFVKILRFSESHSLNNFFLKTEGFVHGID
jgi:hypothetical protein